MISNGSLITEAAARGMIEAGLDAINISVDASGKEVFESTRVGLKYDKVIAQHRAAGRGLREQSGRRRPKLILSFVRQNNSEDEHAFIEHWRTIADKIHITDLHNWAGTLNQKVGRQLSLLSAVADLHGAVGWAGVALLRRLRRPHDPRRPAHPTISEIWNSRHLPRRPPRAPRERRPGHLPVLRPAQEGLAPLGDQAFLGRYT